MNAIKSLAWILVSGIVGFSVFASGISLGVEGGLSLAQFSGKDSRGWNTNAGLCGYGYLNLPIGNQWSLVGEAGYVAKGSTANSSNFEFDFTYIEIPLLLRYTIPTVMYPTSIYGGPTLGYILTAQQINSLGTVTLNNINNSDIGLAVGATLELPMNFGSLLFDVRYTGGLDKPLSKYNTYDWKNSVLSFMVGFNFNLTASPQPAVPSSDNSQNLIQ